MGRYSDLSVEQLQTEIAEYRGARKKAVMGQVGVVAAEGRRMEFTRPDINRLDVELRELQAELARRPGFEGTGNSAIAVEIG